MLGEVKEYSVSNAEKKNLRLIFKVVLGAFEMLRIQTA